VKKILILSVVGIILTFGFSETRSVLRNFHVVEAGNLYRSAQLSPGALEEIIFKYKIKTVVNLQGAHPDDAWYIDEKEVLDRLGVDLVDIPMRSERIPTREEITSLFEAYDHSPRPLLIHCNSGSDRTGEASAIYEIEYMKKTKEEAMEMLSPLYLHFSFLVPSKTYFMSLYKGRNWALNEYDPCKQQYLYFDHRLGQCRHKLVGSTVSAFPSQN
jgi:protein tyrosine/serine phosphatase